MPVSLSNFKTWLKSPQHIRRILVEVDNVTNLTGGSATSYYFANGAYTSTSADSPSNQIYLPYIAGGVSFSENFSITGELSISYGDISLLNADGNIDSYLTKIWVRKPLRIYLGDPSWPKSDFKLIFKGLVADCISSGRDSVNLVILDQLTGLNTAISEATFTTAQTTIANTGNTPQLIPLAFGECFNVTPVLVDKALLEYQVHVGRINDIIEVRDNGLPVEFTKYLTTGKFRLNQAPYGQITCSVQGDAPNGSYTNKVGGIIANIVTNYGINKANFSSADMSNLASFDVANPNRPVGIYISDKQTIIDVCNQLAASVSAKLTTTIGPLTSDSDVGKLKLSKLKYNSLATYTSPILASDIEENSISISEKIPVKAATRLAYCKNWTVQESGLAYGLPPEHVDFFAKEYLFSTDNTDSTIKANYQLSSEITEDQTLLITKVGADLEANERKSLWVGQRYVYTMTCYAYFFDVQLGDAVSITNRRFNLNGTVGTVMSISRDWLSGRIQLGVIV